MSSNQNQREEVFSKSVRAGKRTYFFDVKSTKAQDYYLTITESKKRIGEDGTPFFEKHKIFLYREDFQKFVEGLNEAIQHVSTLKPEGDHSDDYRSNGQVDHQAPGENHTPGPGFTDINFEDLGK